MAIFPNSDNGAEVLIFPVRAPECLLGIELHLQEILAGEAFRGSQRSGQFLKHIIEETISGHQENLKERILGIDIFGRTPSYDTSEDAIVRVTASDVRKRLLQHYGRAGDQGDFRFSLPPGSYVPRITRVALTTPNSLVVSPEEVPNQQSAASGQASSYSPPLAVAYSSRKLARWRALAGVLLLSNIALGFACWKKTRYTDNTIASMTPWSSVITGPGPTLVITSDPNIAEIQGITGKPISLSDYANHKYVSHPELLTPEQNHFCNVILRGDKASVVDTPIVAEAAAIAAQRGKTIIVAGARTIQLTDIQSDKNLIIFGSTRSDPWIDLFQNKLDFRFEYEPNTMNEIIRNVHPRAGETSRYVATAPGWATGESYALIALLQKTDGEGRVLLIAGENGEGTEAAGKLLNDSDRLRRTLIKCGVNPAMSKQNFEILLHLNTLAGSPSNVDTIACHIM